MLVLKGVMFLRHYFSDLSVNQSSSFVSFANCAPVTWTNRIVFESHLHLRKRLQSYSYLPAGVGLEEGIIATDRTPDALSSLICLTVL